MRASALECLAVATATLVARSIEPRSIYDARLTDEEVEVALTEIPGIGPWTAHGFLIVALDRPDVLLPGDLALRQVAGALEESGHEQQRVRGHEVLQGHRLGLGKEGLEPGRRAFGDPA